MRLKFLLFIILLLAFGTISLGKVFASSPSDISVNLTPENPTPNEDTTINLSSYVDNLDTVLITWSLGGKSVSSGIGKKSFSVTAPAAGSETDVTATISLPDGSLDEKIVIRPTVMVLLWQAEDSYVPPFYRGKAMPSPQSEVKVVAMPEIITGGSMVDPANMTYVWKQDYNNVQDSSGYGKNYFIYTNDYLDDSNNIDVTASTIDQQNSSEASINIATTLPKIEFYKNDVTLGTLWEQALSDGHKIQGTETLQAAPYFISPRDVSNPLLTWTWSINDSTINTSILTPDLIPLQTQAGVSGTSKIDLQISNSYKVFETASKEINVTF